MWHRQYDDVPNDGPAKRQKLESGKGLIGCEMHEVMGWQTQLHRKKPKKPGLLSLLIRYFSKEKSDEPTRHQ